MEDWLFLIVFGPLILMSLVCCREERSAQRRWRSPYLDLGPADRQEFSKFLRSNEAVPDPHLAPVAVSWAEGLLSLPKSCRWSRYLGWAWVAWITAGVAAAMAFGTARDIAIRVIFFDVMLLFLAALQFVQRRARAVLAAAGRFPGQRGSGWS